MLLAQPNYTIKKELEHVAYVDTSNLGTKIDFISLKVEVAKL